LRKIGRHRKILESLPAIKQALHRPIRLLSRPFHPGETPSLMPPVLLPLLVLVLFFAPPMLLAQYSTADMASGAKEMIGMPAPAWLHQGWVNSDPIELQDLRGKVVMIRFFNDNPVSAAAVRLLNATYRDQGLAVVGFYVSSPMPTLTDAASVRNLASAIGFGFPVANDSQWQNANRYWLNRAEAEPDAVTFLIDRNGIIRYIQPDGRYEKDSRDRKARSEFEKLEKEIQALLQEPFEDLAVDPAQPAGAE
jgi:peroxiredoxin